MHLGKKVSVSRNLSKRNWHLQLKVNKKIKKELPKAKILLAVHISNLTQKYIKNTTATVNESEQMHTSSNSDVHLIFLP